MCSWQREIVCVDRKVVSTNGKRSRFIKEFQEGSQEISSPSSFCMLLFLAFLRLMQLMAIGGSFSGRWGGKIMIILFRSERRKAG